MNAKRLSNSIANPPAKNMSLIVALHGPSCTVVAGDSQSVTRAGVSLAPYRKVVRISGRLICAYAGCLEIGGVDLKEHLLKALSDPKLTIPKDWGRSTFSDETSRS